MTGRLETRRYRRRMNSSRDPGGEGRRWDATEPRSVYQLPPGQTTLSGPKPLNHQGLRTPIRDPGGVLGPAHPAWSRRDRHFLAKAAVLAGLHDARVPL